MPCDPCIDAFVKEVGRTKFPKNSEWVLIKTTMRHARCRDTLALAGEMFSGSFERVTDSPVEN